MTDVFNWLAGTAGYAAIVFALGLVLVSRFFPVTWATLALTVAFVVLGATFVAQREVTASVQRDYDRYKTDQANKVTELERKSKEIVQQALEKERQSTFRESALADLIEANSKESTHEITRLKALAAESDRRTRSLSGQLTTIADAYVRARDKADAVTTLAADLPPAGEAVGVLAGLLDRCQQRASSVGAFANAAHAAGRSCERDYDAGREALKAANAGLGLKP